MINGTKLKDGNDQIPSKNSTPKKMRKKSIIPKIIIAPVFLFIMGLIPFVYGLLCLIVCKTITSLENVSLICNS